MTGPLNRFQHTRFEKDDFKKILKTVNGVAGEAAIELPNLERVFEKWWPDLKEKVDSIMNTGVMTESKRSDREILEEILGLCRNNNASIPYYGTSTEPDLLPNLRRFIEVAVQLVSQRTPTSLRETALLGEFREVLNDVCYPTGNCDLWDNFDQALNKHNNASDPKS